MLHDTANTPREHILSAGWKCPRITLGSGGWRHHCCPAPVKPLGSLGVLKHYRNAKQHAGLLPAVAGAESEKLIYFHNLQSPGEVHMAKLGTRDGYFLSLAQ